MANLPRTRPDERLRVGDVERDALDRRVRLETVELIGRAVRHGHGVIAGMGQQVDDHRADLAAADHRYVFFTSRLLVGAPHRQALSGAMCVPGWQLPWPSRRFAAIIRSD